MHAKCQYQMFYDALLNYTTKWRKYLQARIFRYLFLFLFSSADDCEFDSEDGGDIWFIS